MSSASITAVSVSLSFSATWSTQRVQIIDSPSRNPPGTTAAAGRPHTEQALAVGIPARRCAGRTPLVDLYSSGGALFTESRVAYFAAP